MVSVFGIGECVQFLVFNFVIALFASNLLGPINALDIVVHLSDHHNEDGINHHHRNLETVEHYHFDTSGNESEDPTPNKDSHTHSVSLSPTAILPPKGISKEIYLLPIVVSLPSPSLRFEEGHPNGLLRPPIGFLSVNSL